MLSGYNCTCAGGYTGTHCETGATFSYSDNTDKTEHCENMIISSSHFYTLRRKCTCLLRTHFFNWHCLYFDLKLEYIHQ